MISVLLNYSSVQRAVPGGSRSSACSRTRKSACYSGPLFVGEPYEIEREVVALSGSRRTESMWVRTRVFQTGGDEVLATMLLNSAYLKDSYPNYNRGTAAKRA